MFEFWCWFGLGVFILMSINYKKHHKKASKLDNNISLKKGSNK